MEEIEKQQTQPKPEYIPKVFVSIVRGMNENENLEQELSKYSILLSRQLREQGVTVNYLEKGNLSKQLKQAQQSKSLLTIIIGEDELKNRRVLLKNMESGEQNPISVDSLLMEIQKTFKSYKDRYPTQF